MTGPESIFNKKSISDMEIHDILGIELIGKAGLELTKSAISGVSSSLSCVLVGRTECYGR